MKYGSIDRFTMLLPDSSIVKGNSAQKNDSRWLKIAEGFYTACKLCENKPPIWNINATTASHDEEKHKMSYQNAVFKFHGTPVFYTPYFSHYTSKADRKSGFLRPIYGGSTYLGKAIKIPYYLNLAPNYDATITPVFTSLRGQVLEGEYRHLFKLGETKTKGSITSTDHYESPSDQAPLKNNIRYNFESKANFFEEEKKNFGWQVNTTSDKIYRRDYGYGSEDFLTSRVFTNTNQATGFFDIQLMSFQNLRPKTGDDENQMHQTPMVLPFSETKHELYRFNDDSRWYLSTNILKIHRYDGPDSNRLSIKNQWQKSLLLDNGNIFNFFSSVRQDIYYYEDAPVNNKNYTGTTSRTIPETGVNWSFPLGKKVKDSYVSVTPIVTAIATPYTNYNKDIYNEDSGESNEINNTNLFSESQFRGIDLVENTPRVGFGIKNSIYYRDKFNASSLLGQMYQTRPQIYFSSDNNNHLSDYIGRINLEFNNILTLSYQFTIGNHDFKNKTNELTSTYQYKKAYITTDLLYYRNGQVVNDVKNRREVYFETGIRDYNNMSFSINARQNLSSEKDNPGLSNGFVNYGGKVKYTDDCIEYAISLNRDLTSNEDKQANTTYWFEIVLKNLS
jgi:LPS-assembly protein